MVSSFDWRGIKEETKFGDRWFWVHIFQYNINKIISWPIRHITLYIADMKKIVTIISQGWPILPNTEELEHLRFISNLLYNRRVWLQKERDNQVKIYLSVLIIDDVFFSFGVIDFYYRGFIRPQSKRLCVDHRRTCPCSQDGTISLVDEEIIYN